MSTTIAVGIILVSTFILFTHNDLFSLSDHSCQIILYAKRYHILLKLLYLYFPLFCLIPIIIYLLVYRYSGIMFYPIVYIWSGIRIGRIMGEIKTLSKASSKIESLRTTMPKSIVRFMKLNEGDKIDWDLKAQDNKIILIVTKVEKKVRNEAKPRG